MKESNNWGVIYVAYGKDYFLEAQNSAKSLKTHNNLPCICFCDKDYGNSVFDKLIIFNEPLENRNYKINSIIQSPFDRTLFIDSDTFILGDISSGFQLLDQFDIACTHSAIQFGPSKISKTQISDLIPDSFIELSSGVIFYNKNKNTTTLFEKWLELYNTTRKKLDQPTFREAIYFSDIRLYVLPQEYNLTITGPLFLEGKAKIIHGRFGRENRITPPVKYEKIGLKLNNKKGRRVFIPGLGILTMKISPNRLKFKNILKGLKRRLKI